MKKFKLQAAAILFVATSIFTACSNDDDTPSVVTKKSLVSKVEGATTVKKDVELPLTVTFGVENNCGAFNKFTETTDGTTKTIEVEAKYQGKDCGTTAATKTGVYKFKSSTTGTFNLKFKKTATEFITHTIVVN